VKALVNKTWIKAHVPEVAAYGGLLFCILLFIIVPPFFGNSILAPKKLATLMSDVIVVALISVGAVFIYSLGNIDISIGKQVGLYATLMVLITNSTGSLLLSVVVCLAIALVLAVVNGVGGEVLRIHSIVPSVVIMFLLSGLSTIIYVSLGTRNISLKGFDYSLFKSPWLMLIVLVLEVAVVTYLFNYTKYGKYARAIGANPVVASQSGVSLIKFKAIAYMIMGVCVVLGSLFRMGYTGAASDSTGTGLEMNVMVALILGGMPLSGGMRSKVSCAVVGSFTFSLLDVGLPLIGIANKFTYLVKALIFIIVVLMTCRKKFGILPR
jgi:ribose transport system permease protein